jgi:hypothetical protein
MLTLVGEIVSVIVAMCVLAWFLKAIAAGSLIVGVTAIGVLLLFPYPQLMKPPPGGRRQSSRL